MSDLKWIRLSLSMFEDEKIRLIEQMPDADTILIIWVKLLAQAGKTNASGYIYLSENIPYTEEMLATIFNRPVNTVRLALKTFEQFGMITIDEKQFIEISNWEKHQNVEGMDRIREQNRLRKQKQRAKEKAVKLLEGNTSFCAYCGKTEKEVGLLHTDHIVPIQNGGTTDDSNLLEACKSCNSSKSDKPIRVYLNDHINHPVNPINVDLVVKNKKLSRFVRFDNNKFYPVTGLSRDSHATEEELEEDKNKKENNNNKYIRDLFNHYISKNIIRHHKLTDPMKRAINARLKDYSFNDLKKAIDNYAAVYKSDTHWFTHKYPLADFMRDKDVRKFLDEADPLINYKKQSYGKASISKGQAYNPTKDAF